MNLSVRDKHWTVEFDLDSTGRMQELRKRDGDESDWITQFNPQNEGCVTATDSDDQNVPIVIVLVGIQVIGHVIGVVEDVVAEREHGIIRLYSKLHDFESGLLNLHQACLS